MEIFKLCQNILIKALFQTSNMLKYGKTIAEIAEYFKVSIKTVNNCRTIISREGMSFPSKRRCRPKVQGVSLVKEKPSAKESQKISTKLKWRTIIL